MPEKKKTLKLKTVKRIMYAGYLLAAICICLIFLSQVFTYTALAVAVLTFLFGLKYYRCPDCGYFVGRNTGRYCAGCGKELDWR